ncbi:hypothetical protein SAMN05421759_101494 [Roseivivax lentus]|uniref:Uncharacterized protein n=1 Tax=Roseivivax lentus TaxID=633194 RepID=A0A1N7K6X0_9RHOB|nr:hypothetical protein SAMN05421759_101494 [Roseivivax lentus]
MIAQFSKLLRAGAIATGIWIATLGAVPFANAQTVSVPTLSYPEPGTVWGCRFLRTCATAPVVTKNETDGLGS